jgi:hypothetical protein
MDKEYQKVMKLLEMKNDEKIPTFAYAIVDQIIPGSILMDEWEKAALIGTHSGIYVVIGDEKSKAIHRLLVDMYKKRTDEDKRFTLYSSSHAWDQVINQLFGNELKQMHRYSFQLNKDKYSLIKKSIIHKEYKVKRIDKRIISESKEFTKAYINEYWESLSNYLENGFGYCILHNDVIVSECISIFASSRYSEMDITTHSRYRGMGLARYTAEIFIKHCIENKMNPIWDCNMNNVASFKLAEKVGFENPIEYSIFVRG